MIIVVAKQADPEQIRQELVGRGLWPLPHRDAEGRVLFLIEPFSCDSTIHDLMTLPGVESVSVAATPHPLVDQHTGAVDVSGIQVGPGHPPVLMAGPCSVESAEQIESSARRLASLGVLFLRGGAFKPRTSPYAFQGFGKQALRWLSDAARRHQMRVVTEAMSESNVADVAEWADLLQVGSRNMHNFALLKCVAAAGKPVLLKRGMAASIEEWLSAGEYLRLHGAPGVIFCERGIRSFDTATRNLLDLSAVALLSEVHSLPVVVDPSHATGRRDLILPLSRAALAVGAAGVMVETHDEPGTALSDGPQALTTEQMHELAAIVGSSCSSR